MHEGRKIILGIPFNGFSLQELIETALSLLNHSEKYQICTPNPEMLLEAQKNAAFYHLLRKPHGIINTPDGIGILWASRVTAKNKFLRLLQGVILLPLLIFWPRFFQKEFSERVTGIDCMKAFAQKCAITKHKIFLLGAAPGVSEMAADRLQNIYPGLKIAGCYSGSPKESDEQEIRRIINLKEPDILFVAFGAPAQELWVHRNLPHLKTVKVAMGIGGAFDFIAGVRARAPKFMQRLGIEWLWRLAQEPKRIKRIFNATIRFPLFILFQDTKN